MDNCPACKREFIGIGDFPKVRVLGVEKGDLADLEKLVQRFSQSDSPMPSLNTAEKLANDEWKLAQKYESLFSNPQNVKKDGLGEYVEAGNNFDDYLAQSIAEEQPLNPQEQEEVAKRVAEFRESRLYREPVMERLPSADWLPPSPDFAPRPVPPPPMPLDTVPPPLHGVLPPSPDSDSNRERRPGEPPLRQGQQPPGVVWAPPYGVAPPPQIPPAAPSPPKQIGWKYTIAKPQDELLGQLRAYVSRLESLVNTVVEPKELLKAELEHHLTFEEVSNIIYEELMPDSTQFPAPPGPDGKPMPLRMRREVNKSPRETAIYFGEYGHARGMGFISPTGGAIAVIKYEGVLDLPDRGSTLPNDLLNDPDG